MRKKIIFTLVFVSCFSWISAIVNNFKEIKFLYALYFDKSTIYKDALVIEKYYNVDGEATDLYHIEGYLKNNKEKVKIRGVMSSLDKDENGNFLVWYCNFKGINYTLIREKDETQIPCFYFNPWFNLVLMALFIPSLLYYIQLKILEKNKK